MTRLYANHCKTFIEDCERNQISEKLLAAAKNLGRPTSPSEVQSWQNSLRALAMVLSRAGLVNQGILLEYQLPMTAKRADCILCGYAQDGSARAVIIELKQWSECTGAAGDNEVTSFVGGRQRDLLHPSAQVGRYATYVSDTHEAFYADANPIGLSACAYLHNYFPTALDPLQDSKKFGEVLAAAPTFSADDVDAFVAFIKANVGAGDGLEVLKRIEENRYRPSKKLMAHVASVIEQSSEFVLLDEQQVAFDAVLTAAKPGVHNRKKQVVIIKGGPGTGKSVVAINLVAALLSLDYSTHYVTGSKAFTGTLRKIIGARGRDLFTYSNGYMLAMPDAVDVLVIDEAHRIRAVSSNRFTPKDKKSDLQQIEELINAARVSVFLIDDDQIVRPGEIGSVAYIREYAAKAQCHVHEYELDGQFRCNGSDAYLVWLNAVLGLRDETVPPWPANGEFDFRIMDSPDALDAAIRARVGAGATGRLTAGFCWPWSEPEKDGTLVADVEIGAFRRPWNAKDGAGRLAKGIPKSDLWAHDPNGIEQVGCVYTAQGFEFDYVGVIFGTDLTYDSTAKTWVSNKNASFDTVVKKAKTAQEFTHLVQNTYRVLLSRGMKGCYVHFLDNDTQAYFQSKTSQDSV
ncbi:MAG: DUF2075 domain-containing protein [Pseudomonadota bacterium]